MGFQLNTDFSNIQPNAGGGGRFPPSDPKRGWLCRITASEAKENKAKNGWIGVLTLRGMEPGVQDQEHLMNINLANPNQQAVDIGQGELSAIAHCIGILRVGNSAELHEKPFRVLVRKQEGSEVYTEVYGIRDVNGNEPGKAGQGPIVATTPPAGGFTPGAGAPAQGGFGPGPGTGAPAQGGGAPGWGGGAPQGQPQGQPAQGGWTGQPTGGQQAPQGGGGWQGGPPQGGQADPNAGQPQGGGAPGWANTPGR